MVDVVSDSKFYADHREQWGPGRTTVMLAFRNGNQLSDNDIAIKYGMKEKTVSARRTELWRLNYVKPVGMKKINRQLGQVWAATAKGHDRIRKLVAARSPLFGEK